MPITSLDRMLITRRKSDRELVPLDTPTTALGANSTSIATAIPIGFTFQFDGVDYTEVALSARGFLRFAGTVTSSSNSNLFGSNTSQVLAPWWDAIETAVTVGYVKYETLGSAPWRIFVAEWYVNLDESYDGTDYVRAKLQVVLRESKNLIEFRYGARVSGGSPANTGSASVGLKGDTSTTTDNYRDCATPSGAPVDDLALGGSKTASTTNLRHYVATEWPGDDEHGWTLVIEPNWPMVGFYVDVSDDDLAGVQDPDNEILWRIANNVNWLYCKYRPVALNVSPWCPASATIANPIHAVPFRPSADALDYDVWIESYSADGSTTLDVGEDSAADPQPSTDGDWSSLATPSDPASSGTQSWPVFQISPDPGTTQLRFKFTDGDHKVMSIMAAPVELDDFDPTATYASGFVPMGVGQIRQEASATHPEFLNRAWRNVARIVTDRVQMLWSLSGGVSTDYDLAPSPPIRQIGIAPCSLSGWRAQTVAVKVLAYDDDDGARCVVGERGGASVAFTVDSNADEYRLQEQELQLFSDEPVIVAQVDPATESHVHAVTVEWTPDLTDEDYIREVTPSPRLEMLSALVERIRRACLYSYGMTGLASMLRRGASNYWRCAWMVPPATKAMRPRVARHASPSSKGSPQETSLYGVTSSGVSSDDEIIIENPHAEDRDDYPPDGGEVQVIWGSLRYDETPAAPGDRLLESPTAGSLTGPAREMVEVRHGVGITIRPIPDDPSTV